MIKDIVYKAISTAGYKWMPSAYSSGLDLSHHIRDLFRSLNINCVIDVGANEGQYRNFLRRRCGYEGTIISFEPVTSTFEIIRKKAAYDSKWEVQNCALGRENGKKMFNIMQDTQFSSFLEPHSTDVDKPDIQLKNKVINREEVLVRTLADIIFEIKTKHGKVELYLKLDTQGFDLEVLQGAGTLLKEVSALQTEIPVKQLYAGMHNFSEALENLGKLGFELTGLFPIGRDRLLRVIEFDCVARRTNHN